MVPLWVAAVFMAILTMFIAVEIPRHEQEKTQISADVAATNMLAYRKAVQDYLKSNPAFAGTVVSDSDMTTGCASASCWPLGYLRDSNWTNLVDGGTLYVYSTSAPDKAILNALQQKLGTTTMFGKKDETTDHLFDSNGSDTGLTLPGSLPDNQIVIMGE